MFNSYFTTYLSTDPPSIITSDYMSKLEINDSTNLIDYNNIEDLKKSLLSLLDKDFNIPDPIPVSIHSTLLDNNISYTYNTPMYSQELPKLTQTKPSSNQTTSKKLDLSTEEKYAKTMYYYLYNALENNGLSGELWTPTLVAQTSVESNWGNKFSRDHNNFAGIKGSNGDPVKTREWSSSRGYYTIIDRFKKYSSIEEFADDFVKKLKNKFNAFKGTPKDYVKNIRSKGYFTDTLKHYQDMMDSRIKKINKLLRT